MAFSMLSFNAFSQNEIETYTIKDDKKNSVDVIRLEKGKACDSKTETTVMLKISFADMAGGNSESMGTLSKGKKVLMKGPVSSKGLMKEGDSFEIDGRSMEIDIAAEKEFLGCASTEVLKSAKLVL